MIHKYLAYLKTIETGSITQAAAELGYTQSAVSRMIADLEEHWDVPLLTRNRSGIEISSEGTQLLPILQSIVKGQEELSFAVGELFYAVVVRREALVVFFDAVLKRDERVIRFVKLCGLRFFLIFKLCYAVGVIVLADIE